MQSLSPERQAWIVAATRLMVNDFDRGIAISNLNILMDQIDIAVGALKKLEKFKSHRPEIENDRGRDFRLGIAAGCIHVENEVKEIASNALSALTNKL